MLVSYPISKGEFAESPTLGVRHGMVYKSEMHGAHGASTTCGYLRRIAGRGSTPAFHKLGWLSGRFPCLVDVFICVQQRRWVHVGPNLLSTWGGTPRSSATLVYSEQSPA